MRGRKEKLLTHPVLDQGEPELLFVKEGGEHGAPIEVEGVSRPVDVRVRKGSVVGKVSDFDDVGGVSPSLLGG